MRYYKLLLILLIVVAGTTSLHAQNANQEWERTDSLAIQFSVNDIIEIDVSPFQAGGISFKKLLPNDRSFRVGLQLTGDHQLDNRNEDKMVTNLDTSYTERDNVEGNWNLRIQSQFLKEYTVSEEERINLYYGLGPALRLGFNQSDVTEINYDPENEDFTNNIWKSKSQTGFQRWQIGTGLSSAIGIEWFFKENFSLMLEYSPRVMIRYNIKTDERLAKEKYTSESEWNKSRDWQSTTHNWSVHLSSSNTRFGLSLYF